MRYQEDDSFLGLENAKRGSTPKGGRRGGPGRRWTGSMSQRVQAAKGSPQAVFKISSYSHSGGGVWDRVNYVGRDGDLELEDENEEMLGQVALERMVEEWSEEEARKTKTNRIAMSAVVSFPADVDQEKATEAARQFFREAYAENHDYVFAPHEDASNSMCMWL